MNAERSPYHEWGPHVIEGEAAPYRIEVLDRTCNTLLMGVAPSSCQAPLDALLYIEEQHVNLCVAEGMRLANVKLGVKLAGAA